MASNRKMKEFKKDSKHTLYQSLPRHLKNMPLVEYLVGSKSTDLYDVIFEVEGSRDFNLFQDSDAGVPSLAAVSVLPASPSSRSPSRGYATLLDSQQTPRSARKRKVSTLAPLQEVSSNAKVLSLDTTTPLSKLFSLPRPLTAVDHEGGVDLQRMQNLLDQYRDLPIRRLQDEMKEMQVCDAATLTDRANHLWKDRQRRIENLLLTLTRDLGSEGTVTTLPQSSSYFAYA